MSEPLRCFYSECELPPRLICNCSDKSFLLCDEHISQHRKDISEVNHSTNDIYIHVQPQEKEAFNYSILRLIDICHREMDKELIRYSKETEQILKEIQENTENLLKRLRGCTIEHRNFIKELNENVTKMKNKLSIIIALGVPTIEKGSFNEVLLTLKEQNQEISYIDILQAVRSH